MNRLFLIVWILMGVTSVSAVPMTINYQGKVEVSGTPFSDTGLFRFALVDATGTTVYWANDDNTAPISEPATDVSVDVTDGLFNVILGETDGMASIPAEVFNNSDVYLRVWFNDGDSMQMLEPDQKLNAVGFAMKSALADDADTVDGLEGADLEESAEIDTDISTHAAVAEAHHAKTTSFSELTDSAADSQIPDDITINYAAAAGNADTLDGLDSSAFGDGNSLDAADGDPVDAVVVDNDGNMKIGAPDSSSKLSVAGSITAEPDTVDGSSITLGTPGGDLGVVMNMGDGSGGVARRWDIKIEKNDDSLRIRDSTISQTRMMIDTSGKIGIGTFPSTKLDVAGTVNAMAFTGDGSGLEGIGDGHSLDSPDGAFQDVVYVDNNGDVSIGTSVGGAWQGSQSIPDNGFHLGNCGDNGYAEVQVDISGAETISEVEIEISINHSYDANLNIWVLSPSGTEVCLSDDNGGSGDNYTNTRFDDDATTSITDGTAPFTGSYQPESPLSDMDGENPNGVWRLRVLDDSGFNTGSIVKFLVCLNNALSSKLSVSNSITALSFIGDGSGISGIDLTSVLNQGNNAAGSNMINLGNVGIGTASPDGMLDVTSSGSPDVFIQTSASFANRANLHLVGAQGAENGDLATINFYNNAWGDDGNPNASIHVESGTNLVDSASLKLRTRYDTASDLKTALTVDESGDIGIGDTTPSYRLEVQHDTHDNVALIQNLLNDNSDECDGLMIDAGHSSYVSGEASNYITFRRPSDFTRIGRIEQASLNSVRYSTGGDKRLANSEKSTVFGLNDLMKLNVVDFTFKDDAHTTQTGLFAQELYSIFPDAVSPGGDDPKDDPWMIDYGRVTPLLVKAMQEQQIQIEILKEELGLKDAEVEDQAASIVEQQNMNTELMGVIQDLRERMEQLEELVK